MGKACDPVRPQVLYLHSQAPPLRQTFGAGSAPSSVRGLTG